MEQMKVEVSCDPRRLDVPLIHRFLSTESHWALGIPRETVERSIANSLCFGAYEELKQVGFARVATDRATFAWLCDVFVIESRRGRGVAAQLMEAVNTHSELQGLRRWTLATRSAGGLYRQYGFTDLGSPEIWMERFDGSVYARGPAV